MECNQLDGFFLLHEMFLYQKHCVSQEKETALNSLKKNIYEAFQLEDKSGL